MEKQIALEITEQGSPEVPSLIKYISSNEFDGFDTLGSQFPSPITIVSLFFTSFIACRFYSSYIILNS